MKYIKEIAINGKKHIIHSVNQRQEIVAAFAVLTEFFT